MASRILVDASFLTSLIRSKDVNHTVAAQFYKSHPDTVWVIPTIAYFEFQAAQSRRGQTYKEVYIEKHEAFEITMKFLHRCGRRGVFERFLKLRGADLVYACISYTEEIPLVTFDKDFNEYTADIKLILLKS